MVLRWKVCVGWQVENPELECVCGVRHVQRGEKGTWDWDCKEESADIWDMAGGGLCRAGRKCLRRTLRGDVFVEISGNGPHGLWSSALGVDAPRDDV